MARILRTDIYIFYPCEIMLDKCNINVTFTFSLLNKEYCESFNYNGNI